ncbi:MAG: PilZ domain-containing protein [Deltaproteobacteria bacterium]
MEERRKHRRLQMSEKTSLSKGDSAEECFLVDISPGGMKVLLEKEPKVGDPITGQFKILPKAGPFYVKGVISWIKKTGAGNYEIGVRFSKISTIPL